MAVLCNGLERKPAALQQIAFQSSSMRYLGLRRTRELIEDYGADRIMFGSDFPMWSPGEEYAMFRATGFSEREFERMCSRNAERWLERDLT